MSRRGIVVASMGVVALACWCSGAMGKYATDTPDMPGPELRLSARSGIASALEETRAQEIGMTGSLGLGFDCIPMGPAGSRSGRAAILEAGNGRSDAAAPASIPPPTVFAFGAPFPNPVERGTTLSFDLPVSSRVTIETFDLGGRRVAAARPEELGAGRYQRTWNGMDDAGRALPRGIYLVRMQATRPDGHLGLSAVRKLLLLR